MKTIGVELGERSYEINLGAGTLGRLPELLSFDIDGLSCALVSDSRVDELYGDTAAEALASAGANVSKIVIPPGEGSKNLEVLSKIYDGLALGGISRKDVIVALGGGVVGDIAGLAAATWMRGVRYIQVPTTLLAMVDSSVGGKTAIDIAAGKNLVGTFHQPSAVVIDTDTLLSLPSREMACGMAEVIKYGLIASERLFDIVKDGAVSAVELDDVICECISIKAGVVSRDERDTGERAVLNFGHSFGHAIELMYGFDEYNHGEAVAQGMVIAAAVSVSLGLADAELLGEVKAAITANALPMPDPDDLMRIPAYVGTDKKASGGEIELVLLEGIGRPVLRRVALGEMSVLLQKAGALIW